MLSYRTFCNIDPPVLLSIWRSRAGQRGLLQPISVDVLEQLVFAKLYFDYQGLFLAFEGNEAVGFAHAGFGPNEGQDAVDPRHGVTCLVMARAGAENTGAMQGLLEQCEAYLKRAGSQVLYGGGIQPIQPFYLGLYGGSELPGVLQSDTASLELFRSQGYEEIDQTLIVQRSLERFQVPIDRQQQQLRRQMAVEVTVDAPAATWWQACTTGDFDLTRFQVLPRGGGPVLAQATFRSMEPAGVGAFVRTAGLLHLTVDAAHRRRGLGMFLLSEAFQNFARQGILQVEAQTLRQNAAVVGLLGKLGFHQADQGSVFRKNV